MKTSQSKILLSDVAALCMILLKHFESLIVGTNDKKLLRIDPPYTNISFSKETELSQIECLAEAEPGKFWASGSSSLLEEARILLFSKELSVLRSLKGHSETVLSLAFHDNSLYSASEDCTIKVWTEQSSVGKTLYIHQNPIISFAFDSFSEHIASSDTDCIFKVFSLVENREIMTKTLNDKIWSMKFVPGKYLIICGDHLGNLVGLNFRTKKEEFSSNIHESRIKSIWITGNFVVTGSFDQKACVRNINEIDKLVFAQEHIDWVRCVCANERLVFSGSDDKTILFGTYNEVIENYTENICEKIKTRSRENPKMAGGLALIGVAIVALILYLIISS